VKVVLDTNVFISGIFFTGPPYDILSAWRDGDVKIVVSAEILDEYQRVGSALTEQFPDTDIGPILELVTVEAELVHAPRLSEPVCKDPDDEKFIAWQ
jgi:putative PIN family toxin of toxin-antitoxin system